MPRVIAKVARPVFATLITLLCSLPATSTAQTASLLYCDKPPQTSAAQKDKLLRMSQVVKNELERSGQNVALVSRSGLNLRRFNQRYSHAGFSLLHNAETPWAVRQLYYACDEGRPRIFDQGISGFLMGTDNPDVGYLSVIIFPDDESHALERTALDNQVALTLLSSHYSANAYPFSLAYQNCNQWVIEMIATALSSHTVTNTQETRSAAQDWLQQHDYMPSAFKVNRLLKWASHFVKWVHSDDHPKANLMHGLYQVTMPESIETFIHTTMPNATRVEFCHNTQHMVIHRGWDAIADHCEPSAQDTVIDYDEQRT